MWDVAPSLITPTASGGSTPSPTIPTATGAFSYVNSVRGASGSATPTYTLAATSLTTGNHIFIFVKWPGAVNTVSSVTDTAGNTYSTTDPASTGNTIINGKWYWCLSATGNASNVVTITMSGITANVQAGSVQFSKVGNVAVLDQTSENDTYATAATSISSVPINTNMGGLFLGAIGTDFGGTSSTWTSSTGSSYTQPYTNDGSNTLDVAYSLTTTALTQNVLFEAGTLVGNRVMCCLSITEAPTVAYDPYLASYVTLLVHGQGNNSGTIFLDSSITNKTLSRSSGSTAVTSTTQAKWGTTSIFAGSANGYVAPSTSSADLSLSGDFTVECWVYLTDISVANTIWATLTGGTTFSLATTATTGLIQFNGGGTTTALSTGQWYHISVSRTSSTSARYSVYMVVNGKVAYRALVSSTNGTGGVDSFGIGGSASAYLRGYVADFRVSKGMGRYPGNFTVPGFQFYDTATTSANTDPYWNNVVFMSHFDGPNGSTAFADSSQSSKTISAYSTGSPTLSSTQAKFGSTSLKVGGAANGTVYTPTASTDWSFVLYDFTVELWFYGNNFTNRSAILNLAAGLTNQLYFKVEAGGGSIIWALGVTSASITKTVTASTWHHTALCRQNGVMFIFLDGILLSSSTPAAINFSVSTLLYLGVDTSLGVGVQQLDGYIDDVRITKGVARYVRSFAVPTAAYPNVAPAASAVVDPYYAATTLLLPGTGTNGSTTFTDSGPQAFAMTPVGNAQISTTQSKWGSGAIFFDGSGDYANMTNTTTLLTFEDGWADFTVECWVLFTDTTAQINVFSLFGPSNASAQVAITIAAPTRQLNVIWFNGSPTPLGTTLTTNTWHHIALSRLRTTWYLFQDGTLSGSGTQGSPFGAGGPNRLYIGAANGPSSISLSPFYMSDFRFTRGVARYYNNSYPMPTLSLPTTAPTADTDPYWGNVLLLLKSTGAAGTSTITDLSTNNTTLTNWGGLGAAGNTTNGGVSYKSSHVLWNIASFSATAIGTATGCMTVAMGSVPSLWNFDSVDCTIEAWHYFTDNAFSGGGLTIFSNLAPGGSVGGFSFGLTAGAFPVVSFAGATNIGNTLQVTLSMWNHIALVKSGTSYKVYINGALAHSVTGTANTPTGSNIAYGVVIWGTIAGSTQGYPSPSLGITNPCDSLRITRGVARYTSAFAVPTAPFGTSYAPSSSGSTSPSPTPTIGTVLLLHGDGPNGSSTIVDSSASAHPMVGVGSTYISTNQSKYSGSSISFSGGTLYTAWDSDFDLAPTSTSSFTIDFWLFLTSGPGGTGVVVFDSVVGVGIVITASSIVTLVIYDTATTTKQAAAGSAISSQAWHHVAAVLNAGTMTVYLDGIGGTPVTLSTVYSVPNPYNYRASVGGFSGFLDDFRISKGVALYTAGFAPPTTVISNPPSLAPTGTTLLLHLDTYPAVDSSSYARTASGSLWSASTTNPLPAVGTGSMKFGGGNYLTVLYAQGGYLTPWDVFNPSSTGTIEFWMYVASATNVSGSLPLVTWEAPYLIWYYIINWNVSGRVSLIVYNQDLTRTTVTATTTAPAGQWNHIAVVNNLGTYTVYVNGNGTSFTPTAVRMLPSSNYGAAGATPSLCIGFQDGTMFFGNMDEFKVSSTANYSGNFAVTIPPAIIPKPQLSGTVLLLSFNGATGSTSFTGYLEGWGNVWPVFNPNNLTVTSPDSKFGSGSAYFSGYPNDPMLWLTPYYTSTYACPWDIMRLNVSGTVEMWVKTWVAANRAGSSVMVQWGADSTANPTAVNWSLGIDSTTLSVFLITSWHNSIGASHSNYYNPGAYVTASTWTHIAVVNNNGSVRIYINGVAAGSGPADFTSYPPTPWSDGNLLIGAGERYYTGVGFTGNMDDLRISSYAVYTSNFTPPTSPLS